MRKRTRSREFALQILYRMDMNHSDLIEVLTDFWEDRSKLLLPGEEKDLSVSDKKDPEIRKYSEGLVRGTLGKAAPIDKLIERFA